MSTDGTTPGIESGIEWLMAAENIDELEAAVDVLERMVEEEHAKALDDIRGTGSLVRDSIELPGRMAWRGVQMAGIESCVRYVDLLIDRRCAEVSEGIYGEHSRKLTQKDIERLIGKDDEVHRLRRIGLRVREMYDRWKSLMRAMEMKAYALSSVAKLRSSGIEDVSFDFDVDDVVDG